MDNNRLKLLVQISLLFFIFFTFQNISLADSELDEQKKVQFLTDLDNINKSINNLSSKLEALKIDNQIKDIQNTNFVIPVQIKQEDNIGFKAVALSLLDILKDSVPPAVIGLIVTLYLNNLENKKNRKKLTIEVWRNWDNKDMREGRIKSWRVFNLDIREMNFSDYSQPNYMNKTVHKIINFYKKDINLNDNTGMYPKNEEEANKVFCLIRICDFFDRLNNLKEKKYIDEKLAQYLFEEDYLDWYEFFNADLEQELKKVTEAENLKSDLNRTVENTRSCKWLLSENNKKE